MRWSAANRPSAWASCARRFYWRPQSAVSASRASEGASGGFIAIHEAGHAVRFAVTALASASMRKGILPAGHGAWATTLTVPEERVIYEKRSGRKRLCVLLAGRAAGKSCSATMECTGAESDLSRAAEIAGGNGDAVRPHGRAGDFRKALGAGVQLQAAQERDSRNPEPRRAGGENLLGAQNQIAQRAGGDAAENETLSRPRCARYCRAKARLRRH